MPLFLLDTELPENDGMTRWITSRLYDGDPDTRLAQYALLGVGGVAALRALGIEPGVVHLNEGHAAFAALEPARARRGRRVVRGGARRRRRRTVFTTHTPVPAGNDTYPADQVARRARRLAERRAPTPRRSSGSGARTPTTSDEPFGVTQFALRTSRAANGVSRRHGEVSREMWQALWPDRAVDDVPIRHVTNGVHVPSWVGAPMRQLLDRHLGEDWALRADDPATLGGHRRRSPTRSCGRCATSSARCSSTSCASAACSTASRAATPRHYVEAAAQRVRPRRR